MEGDSRERIVVHESVSDAPRAGNSNRLTWDRVVAVGCDLAGPVPTARYGCAPPARPAVLAGSCLARWLAQSARRCSSEFHIGRSALPCSSTVHGHRIRRLLRWLRTFPLNYSWRNYVIFQQNGGRERLEEGENGQFRDHRRCRQAPFWHSQDCCEI